MAVGPVALAAAEPAVLEQAWMDLLSESPENSVVAGPVKLPAQKLPLTRPGMLFQ